MTVILALDTATAAVTAGLVRLEDLAVLAERVTVDARAHAERLTPNVLAALADAALTMADLDAVVVGCGPGPFTGLRAGMAVDRADVQARFRRLVRQAHPDHGGAHVGAAERLAELAEARELLLGAIAASAD